MSNTNRRILHEIAVEPVSFTDWYTFDRITSHIAPEKGVLISQFPKKSWKRSVWKSISGLRDMQKKKVEQRLMSIVFSHPRRKYEGSDWLDAAMQSDKGYPFDAILVADDKAKLLGEVAKVKLVSDIDGDYFKRFPREQIIDKKAESVVDSIHVFLLVARKVMLIDPYFNPTKDRYWRLIDEVTSWVKDGPNNVKEIIYCTSEKHGAVKGFEDCVRNKLKAHAICLRVPVIFQLWDDSSSSIKFHDRYILDVSDPGMGIKSTYGLDEYNNQQTTLDMMEKRNFKKIASYFDKDTSPFVLRSEYRFPGQCI
ncbi:hypothetical protein [Thiolapillus sp.]